MDNDGTESKGGRHTDGARVASNRTTAPEDAALRKGMWEALAESMRNQRHIYYLSSAVPQKDPSPEWEDIPPPTEEETREAARDGEIRTLKSEISRLRAENARLSRESDGHLMEISEVRTKLSMEIERLKENLASVRMAVKRANEIILDLQYRVAMREGGKHPPSEDSVPTQLLRKIMMVLHPDRMPTTAEREDALKELNAWREKRRNT